MLQGHNIRILDWPSWITDLNPIEYVWEEIDRRVRQLPQPQNLMDLERELVNIWNRFLFNYVNSMRNDALLLFVRTLDTRYVYVDAFCDKVLELKCIS